VASLAPKNFALAIILVPGLAIHGCHSEKTSAGPSIEFTKIPPGAQGGRERTDKIAGRVREEIGKVVVCRDMLKSQTRVRHGLLVRT
jgi:hypothetical protein